MHMLPESLQAVLQPPVEVVVAPGLLVAAAQCKAPTHPLAVFAAFLVDHAKPRALNPYCWI
jgi:hypothetical protein